MKVVLFAFTLMIFSINSVNAQVRTNYTGTIKNLRVNNAGSVLIVLETSPNVYVNGWFPGSTAEGKVMAATALAAHANGSPIFMRLMDFTGGPENNASGGCANFEGENTDQSQTAWFCKQVIWLEMRK